MFDWQVQFKIHEAQDSTETKSQSTKMEAGVNTEHYVDCWLAYYFEAIVHC